MAIPIVPVAFLGKAMGIWMFSKMRDRISKASKPNHNDSELLAFVSGENFYSKGNKRSRFIVNSR
jgi:hypothetical protein